MQLGPQVHSRAQHHQSGVGQPVGGAFDLVQRVGPLAAELHYLGPMHQALPAVHHEVRLGVTPSAQRGGPLVGAPHIEHLVAPFDHRAVSVAHRDGRHLVGTDRHHRLVEQCHAGGDFAHIDEAPADADTSQRADLDVTEAVANLHGRREAGVANPVLCACPCGTG